MDAWDYSDDIFRGEIDYWRMKLMALERDYSLLKEKADALEDRLIKHRLSPRIYERECITKLWDAETAYPEDILLDALDAFGMHKLAEEYRVKTRSAEKG